MSVTNLSIKEIAKLGGNIELSENSNYTTLTVKELIKIVVKNGRQITIHAGSYTSLSLKEFIKLGNGNITIIF